METETKSISINLEMLDSLDKHAWRALEHIVAHAMEIGYYDIAKDKDRILSKWGVKRGLKDLEKQNIIRHKNPVSLKVRKGAGSIRVDYPERYELTNTLFS